MRENGKKGTFSGGVERWDEGSDNYKSNRRTEMKSVKKGKEQGRARYPDSTFAHFTSF